MYAASAAAWLERLTAYTATSSSSTTAPTGREIQGAGIRETV